MWIFQFDNANVKEKVQVSNSSYCIIKHQTQEHTHTRKTIAYRYIISYISNSCQIEVERQIGNIIC